MKAYPKMKDSGIEWIGEIPQHWKEVILKYEFRIKKGKLPEETYDEKFGECIPYLSMEFLRGLVNPTFVKKNQGIEINHDDILILYDGSNAGEIFTGRRGALSSTMASFNQKGSKLKTSYLFYYLKFLEQDIKNNTIGMGIPHVDGNYIKNLLLVFPSKEEQKQIINFLDSQTKQIDSQIESNQKLVTLLQEKRQATINQAVTKGLDPTVPMKDSGIEWIGKIPEHWNVMKFKFLTSRIIVGIAENATSFYRDDGIPMIFSANVKPNQLLLENMGFIDEQLAIKNHSKSLKTGDILIVRTGANFGDAAVVPSHLNTSQCFTLLISSLNQNYIPQFFCYCINSDFIQKYFQVVGWGSAQPNLSVPIIQEMIVPVPEQNEQIHISKFLENVLASFDSLISKISIQTEKLREFRQSLISAAVTGKIDVRKEVIVQ